MRRGRGGTYRHVAEMFGVSVGMLHPSYAEYGERAECERAQWRDAFAEAQGRDSRPDNSRRSTSEGFAR